MRTWAERFNTWESREFRRVVKYARERPCPMCGKAKLNVSKLARDLGLDRTTVYRLAKKHGVALNTEMEPT